MIGIINQLIKLFIVRIDLKKYLLDAIDSWGATAVFHLWHLLIMYYDLILRLILDSLGIGWFGFGSLWIVFYFGGCWFVASILLDNRYAYCLHRRLIRGFLDRLIVNCATLISLSHRLFDATCLLTCPFILVHLLDAILSLLEQVYRLLVDLLCL